MIQRIQSLLLLVSGCSLFSLFWLPIAKSETNFGNIFNNGILDLDDNIGLLVLTILGGLIALVSIFLFRNRRIQTFLGYFVAFLAFILVVFAYWLFSTATPNLASSSDSASLGTGFFMPMVAFILSLVATFYIRRDEKLVKSMDRLR